VDKSPLGITIEREDFREGYDAFLAGQPRDATRPAEWLRGWDMAKLDGQAKELGL
jgi:hypothetical protein